MADHTWATITLHVPASGWPGYASDHLLGLPHPFAECLPEEALQDPELDAVLRGGGTITITESDAAWGWPTGINLDDDKGTTLQIPDGIDYDYHSQARYEIPCQVRFRRGKDLRVHDSNDRGDILLDRHDLETALGRGLSLADAVHLTDKPAPSGPVPDRHWQLNA